jgi:hypothetical protein
MNNHFNGYCEKVEERLIVISGCVIIAILVLLISLSE